MAMSQTDNANHERFMARHAFPTAIAWHGLTIYAPTGVYHPHPNAESSSELLWLAAYNVNPKGKRILELGCGTGAVGLWLAHAVRHNDVWLSDIDAVAVSTAEINGMANGLSVSVRQGNLFDGLPEGMLFDVILFNPPLWNSSLESQSDSIAMDPGFGILRSFLTELDQRLDDRGEAIVLMTEDAMALDEMKRWDATKMAHQWRESPGVIHAVKLRRPKFAAVA